MMAAIYSHTKLHHRDVMSDLTLFDMVSVSVVFGANSKHMVKIYSRAAFSIYVHKNVI